MSNNNTLQKYDILVSIWKRWDESYWTSFYVFVLVTGLLFAGYAQIYDREIIIACIISIAGIIISIIWIFILNRKLTHIYLAEKEGRKLEELIFVNKDINQKLSLGCFRATKNPDRKFLSDMFKSRQILTNVSSGLLVSLAIPIVIVLTWFAVFVVTYFMIIIEFFIKIHRFCIMHF